MVNQPFTDDTAKGSILIPQGDFKFLPITLREEEGGALESPADGAFQEVDIRRIEDPGSNDVTSSWVTSALDPDDDNDVWDSDHSTYVGDEATPENVGLFAEGWNNGTGTPTGRIAQKVKAPDNATKTNNSTDTYEIFWSVKMPNGDKVSDSETFNVGPPGVILFTDVVVDVDDVTLGMSTSLSDADVRSIITEAELRVKGFLEDVFIDPSTLNLNDGARTVKAAILDWARVIIFDRDASNFGKVSNVREGDAAVGLAGNSNRNREDRVENIEVRLERFATAHSPLNKPRVHRAVQASLNRNNINVDSPRGTTGGGDPN